MAISKILHMKDSGNSFHARHLKRALDYVMNPEKTQRGRLTFLDSTKDYKLYDEQNRVVTTQKGTELYTHYDKVELSVRERYEKVQKQQKKTTQKKTVTTKKAR